jgi:Protein of unknown function (DUF2975)
MTHPTPQQDILQKQSRRFRGLSSMAVGVTLLAVVAQIAVAAAPLWKGGPVQQALLDTGRQFLLSLPALLYVAALYYARRAFLQVADGDVFAPSNGEGLRAMGRCLLIGGVCAMVVQGLVPYSPSQPLALTMSEVARSSSDVVLAALGLALIMIGRLMTMAAALKAENDRFV